MKNRLIIDYLHERYHSRHIMIHDEFEVRTGDGLTLFVQSWVPDGEFDCITCVIHGLGDHSGRYAEFVEIMVKNRIGIFAMDMRGHGQSQGKKGHTPDFEYLLSDVELLLMETRRRYPEIPIILFGHSLGGTIVSNFVLKHKSKEISGAIISAAWFRLAFKLPKVMQGLSGILSRILPALSFSDSTNPMDLTKDPEIGKAFLDDPLKHESVTPKMYTSASDAANWCLENTHHLRYPLLVYHGDEDRFTSFEASREFSESAGDLAKFKLWKGVRHEPHNDIERQEVLQYQVSWIRKILS